MVIDLDEPWRTEARAEQYKDWVDRMRQKRKSNQQRIRGSDDQEAPSYWRAEDVFREGRHRASTDARTRSDAERDDLLAILGLSGNPPLRQIEIAFRRLAMEHHPDRHVDADEHTRAHHLEQMRRINEAYAELRRLQA
jgi:hypothetical protein